MKSDMKQRDESGGGSDFVMSTMLHGFASLHSCVDGGGDATVSCLCEGGALALGTTVRDRLGRLGHVAGPASLRAAAQAWSADGSILAVAAAGGGVQLYIGSALALLAPRIAPSMRGVCATTRVAVAFVAATRTVRVDDPRPPLPQRHVLVAAASASGVMLHRVVLDELPPRVGELDAAQQWKHRSTAPVATLVRGYSVCCVRFGGACGERFVAVTLDGHVGVWATDDLTSETPALWTDIVKARVTSARFSPDARALALGRWDGTVSIFCVRGGETWESGAVEARHIFPSPLAGIAAAVQPTLTPWVRGSERMKCGTFAVWSPDGAALAVANGVQRALWVHFLDLESRDEHCVFVCRVDARGLASIANGFVLAGLLPRGSSDGGVRGGGGWERSLTVVQMQWPVASGGATRTTSSREHGDSVEALARDAAAWVKPPLNDEVGGGGWLPALVNELLALPVATRAALHPTPRLEERSAALRRVPLFTGVSGRVALLLAAGDEGESGAGGEALPALLEIAWGIGDDDGAATIECVALPIMSQHAALRASIAPPACCAFTLALTLTERCLVAAIGTRLFAYARGDSSASAWEEIAMPQPSTPPRVAAAREDLIECEAVFVDDSQLLLLVRGRSGAAHAAVLKSD